MKVGGGHEISGFQKQYHIKSWSFGTGFLGQPSGIPKLPREKFGYLYISPEPCLLVSLPRIRVGVADSCPLYQMTFVDPVWSGMISQLCWGAE